MLKASCMKELRLEYIDGFQIVSILRRLTVRASELNIDSIILVHNKTKLEEHSNGNKGLHEEYLYQLVPDSFE